LRIAARLNRIALLPIRFAQLVAHALFLRKPIDRIDKPPEVNPSRPRHKTDPAQLLFTYA
jgi:putative transposase